MLKIGDCTHIVYLSKAEIGSTWMYKVQLVLKAEKKLH